MQYTTLLLASVATLALAQDTVVSISEGLTTVLTLPAFPGGSATSTTAPPPGDATSTPIPTGVNTDAQNSYISKLLSDAVNTSSASAGNTLISVTSTTTKAATGPYTTSTGSGVANPTGSYVTYYPSGTGAVSPSPTQFVGAAPQAMGGSALALMVAVAGLVLS